MAKKILIIAIAVLFLVLLIWYFFPSKTYEKFEYSIRFNDEKCEHYYKSCRCFGSLNILESYPPEYECRGFEICKDIDVFRGEGCAN